MVIGGSILYNLSAKETPEDIQPFASLSITYFVAAVLSCVLFFLLGGQVNFFTELQKTNWTSWVLSFTLLFMELGYIYMYRAGWKMGLGSLVGNISASSILLVIGVFLYKEALTLVQLLGIAVCIVGLVLVNLSNDVVDISVESEQ